MWRERWLLPSLLLVMRRDPRKGEHGFYKTLPGVHFDAFSLAPPPPPQDRLFQSPVARLAGARPQRHAPPVHAGYHGRHVGAAGLAPAELLPLGG